MVYEVGPDIQGLIFDFDGTIVDSMPVHYLSWQEAFAAFGETFTEQFFYEHAGVSLIGVVVAYNNETGSTLAPEAVVALKDKCHLKYLSRTRVIPEVMDVIEHYEGVLPMAVATGNSRTLTEPLMTRMGLFPYFKAVVYGEDVAHSKPHPECFLKAAAALELPPQRCEVFEDGDPGIEGAKRAGMKVTDIRPWRPGSTG